jgi:energy-coupling factor transporter transmembrane protein EcfT
MNFVAVSSKGTWHPIMTSDTTIQSYWLNWKVLICVILIILSTIFSSLLIWKYEVLLLSWKPTRNDDMEIQKQTSSSSLYLYEDETWKPCLKGIHPAWLLAFRVFAFIVLLVLLILTATTDGGSIFYYYTQ